MPLRMLWSDTGTQMALAVERPQRKRWLSALRKTTGNSPRARRERTAGLSALHGLGLLDLTSSGKETSAISWIVIVTMQLRRYSRYYLKFLGSTRSGTLTWGELSSKASTALFTWREITGRGSLSCSSQHTRTSWWRSRSCTFCERSWRCKGTLSEYSSSDIRIQQLYSIIKYDIS